MALNLRLVLLAHIALLALGCGGGGVDSVVSVEGVTITAHQRGPGKYSKVGKSADGVHGWKFGELEFGLDHMRLKVNGQDYGEVKAGDQIRIDESKVTVNGTARSPVADTPQSK
jgi:hypothetical protein